jgi:small-conductance mechanosensitive channel
MQVRFRERPMKSIFCSVVACFLFLNCANGQSAETAEPHHSTQAATQAANSQRESDDVEQMRADLGRLKVLLNQMRTNLAFVQTTQTPLKHQFELETDAWMVIVEQMDRRLKQMEDRRSPGSAR